MTFKRVSVRDQSSRWGSCSNTGVLSFSWRLILAPTFVLDYLAAHEVAHLVELNHSPRFWRLLKRLNPDCDRAKAWLDAHGADLHRYGVPVRGPPRKSEARTCGKPAFRRKSMNAIARALGAAALAAAAVALPAWAQTFPTRTVHLVVSYAPGGTGDIVAPLSSDRLAAALGQTVVVENSGGVPAARLAPRAWSPPRPMVTRC